MYGFIYLNNEGLEWLLDDVGFIPKLTLNVGKNLSFIVFGAITCVRRPVYMYAFIRHVQAALGHVCAYA